MAKDHKALQAAAGPATIPRRAAEGGECELPLWRALTGAHQQEEQRGFGGRGLGQRPENEQWGGGQGSVNLVLCHCDASAASWLAAACSSQGTSQPPSGRKQTKQYTLQPLPQVNAGRAQAQLHIVMRAHGNAALARGTGRLDTLFQTLPGVAGMSGGAGWRSRVPAGRPMRTRSCTNTLPRKQRAPPGGCRPQLG